MMAFPDLATENKVEFLPFLLEGIAVKKELNQGDGIHPNDDGQRSLVAAVEETANDAILLDVALGSIENLNKRYSKDRPLLFHLFSRRRKWNP